MALIKCPECGGEISDKAVQCPHCGYEMTVLMNEPIENNIPNKKQQYIGIGMCILACVLFIFAIKNITDDKYKFYVENYDTYVAGYEENSNTASQYSGGFFKSGYDQIASSYKSMADDAKKVIWTYRITAIVSCGVGIFLVFYGTKKIKKNRRI